MKTLFLTFALFSFLAHAKVFHKNQNFFVEVKGKSVPMLTLNDLIEKKQISTVKVYRGGQVHMVSFAKNGEGEKNYSVDEKGYIYSIEPFTNYNVKDVDASGEVIFKEKPSQKYFITSNGFFIHR